MKRWLFLSVSLVNVCLLLGMSLYIVISGGDLPESGWEGVRNWTWAVQAVLFEIVLMLVLAFTRRGRHNLAIWALGSLAVWGVCVAAIFIITFHTFAIGQEEVPVFAFLSWIVYSLGMFVLLTVSSFFAKRWPPKQPVEVVLESTVLAEAEAEEIES